MARVATPQTFFDAALDVLAGGGRGALRIGSLCARVGVTSGSFYHHFGGWEGFVAGLLEHWEHEQLARIVALVEDADPADRLALLKAHTLRLPHEAEAAIRGWAGTDPTVAEAQRRVDDGRRTVVRDVLAPLVGDPAPAERLADVAMSVLVGHQQLSHTPGAGAAGGTGLAAMLDELEALVLGHAARTGEQAING